MGQGKRQQKYLSAQEKLQTAKSDQLRAGLRATRGGGGTLSERVEESKKHNNKVAAAKDKVEKNKAPKTKGRKP